MIRGSCLAAGAAGAALLALSMTACTSGGEAAAPPVTPPAQAPPGPPPPTGHPGSPTAKPQVKVRPVRGKAPLVFHGPRERDTVALTFDADMTPSMLGRLNRGEIRSSYDQRIIRTLRATRTPATIFAAGMWIERYPKETRGLAADPLLEFANHSYRHSAFKRRCYTLDALAPGEMAADVRRTTRLLDSNAPGHPPYFRFPGGCYDDTALRRLAGAGVVAIQWDVVSGDAFGPDPNLIVRNVLAGVKGGSIVIMHLNGAPTAPQTHAALPRIIEGLKAKGLRPVKLSDLLR